jgi:hypothetical protein
MITPVDELGISPNATVQYNMLTMTLVREGPRKMGAYGTWCFPIPRVSSLHPIEQPAHQPEADQPTRGRLEVLAAACGAAVPGSAILATPVHTILA